MPFFGLVFLKKSQALSSDNFAQVDATHWVLDLSQTVTDYHDIRDVCVFLTAGAHQPRTSATSLTTRRAHVCRAFAVLPPDAALTVHVQAGTSEWEYRGALCNDTPSDVFPLQWPRDCDGNWAPGAKLGITVEPLVRDLIEQEK